MSYSLQVSFTQGLFVVPVETIFFNTATVLIVFYYNSYVEEIKELTKFETESKKIMNINENVDHRKRNP